MFNCKKCLKEFKYKNRQELWEDWHRMIESSWESWFSNTDWEPPPLSPVIRLKDSVSQGSPLFWDMIEYKIILWDTDNLFQNYLKDSIKQKSMISQNNSQFIYLIILRIKKFSKNY